MAHLVSYDALRNSERQSSNIFLVLVVKNLVRGMRMDNSSAIFAKMMRKETEGN